MKYLADKPRLLGLIFFLIGGGISYEFYNYTIDEAMKHEKETLTMPHGFAILVCFALLGLAMMVFGHTFTEYSKGLKDRKKTIKDYLLIACFVIPGLLAFHFLQHQLAQLGYE